MVDDDADECPNCGAPLKPDAVFCHECGSDAETGWREDSDLESLDLPQGYSQRDDDEDVTARRRGPSTGRVVRWPILIGVPVFLLGLWILLTSRPEALLAAPFAVAVPALLLLLIGIALIRRRR